MDVLWNWLGIAFHIVRQTLHATKNIERIFHINDDSLDDLIRQITILYVVKILFEIQSDVS